MRTVGEIERLTFQTFSDAAGTVPADPTAIVLQIHLPDGTTSTKNWPSPADITRDSLGNFHFDLILTLDGDYEAYWQATGAVTTAKRVSFSVLPAFDSPPPFATPDVLAKALGIATPTDELLLGSWEAALADASGYLRTVIGQPITAGTATLDLLTDRNGEADVWLVPVTSITSITDLDTNTVLTTDRWQLKDQRLYLPRGCTTYRVVLAYGYAKPPAEIVRWTKVLAAVQIQVAPTGSLGVDNVTSVSVDDGKVSYSGGMAVELPASVAQSLKATFGGPQ